MLRAVGVGDTCARDEGGEGGSFVERAFRVVEFMMTKGEDNRLLALESDNEGDVDLSALSDPLDGVRACEVAGIRSTLVVREMVEDTARREGDGGEVDARKGEAGRFRELLFRLGDPARLGAAECDADVA